MTSPPEWAGLLPLGGVHVHRSLRFPSGATPADLLVASIAAEPISPTYLRPGIGWARMEDLSFDR